MTIDSYKNELCEAVSALFYQTVHTVNAKDYSQEQLNAWVNSSVCLILRRQDLLTQKTLVATHDGKLVGFGSITKSGELDLLFVDRNYQRQGIATALCNELEKGFSTIKTYASVTAKAFFEQRSYVVIQSQEVERDGIKLKNYEMQKNTR